MLEPVGWVDNQDLERALVASDASTTPRDVYSVLITFAGAAVLAITKKLGCAVASTHEAESVATVRASEYVIYARIVLHALGVRPTAPTVIATDNLANQRVSQQAKASSRSFSVLRTFPDSLSPAPPIPSAAMRVLGVV